MRELCAAYGYYDYQYYYIINSPGDINAPRALYLSRAHVSAFISACARLLSPINPCEIDFANYKILRDSVRLVCDSMARARARCAIVRDMCIDASARTHVESNPF